MMNFHSIHVIDAGPGWLVVEKPANVSVHNEPDRDLLSLVKRHLLKDESLAERSGYDPCSMVAPVHRLDRETSGVMILGLNADMCKVLTRQFEGRTVKKHYTALVHGVFDAGDDPILWDWPLSPGAGGRNNPAGEGKKIPCKTRIRVIDRSPHYALIDCELITGRKHQIRRHAKLSGHPLLGDQRYGSKRAVEFIKRHASFDRLALHSRSLTIQLPGEKEDQTFSSQVPQSFFALLDEDKKKAP